MNSLQKAHLIVAILTFISCIEISVTAGAATSRIDVLLWFDTEDYLLPADDDASKRLADMLTERGIRATFKIVGEKARVLEKRGRADVISALKRHDIGYHANFHSVHPTPSEYLADCGLLDGTAEFARREGPGAEDVRRIFGVPTLSCYGQPGSSWGAQTMAGLRQIGVAPHGVPCYVDEGNHVGLKGKPFWDQGALVVYDMGANWTRMDLHDAAAVEPAKQKVSAIAERLRSEDGGGLISIFYHPCEWVHQEFWDGVNFRRGANPPREDWKAPPQRSPGETEAAFQRFGEYIDHIRKIPNVRFITASDLPLRYPDFARVEGVSQETVRQMATQLRQSATEGIDFQVFGGASYSIADQFELLVANLASLIDGKPMPDRILIKGLLGPDSVAPTNRLQRIPWPAFRDTTRDVANFIQTEHRVPSRIFFGADPVAPLEYLAACADVYLAYLRDGHFPGDVDLSLSKGVRFLPSDRVAQDTPNLFGGWVIHKEGFRAPKILEIARLQAWTLKPAMRKVE